MSLSAIMSYALSDVQRGGCHVWISCRCNNETIISLHDLGIMLWIKIYASVIHLIVSLAL